MNVGLRRKHTQVEIGPPIAASAVTAPSLNAMAVEVSVPFARAAGVATEMTRSYKMFPQTVASDIFSSENLLVHASQDPPAVEEASVQVQGPAMPTAPSIGAGAGQVCTRKASARVVGIAVVATGSVTLRLNCTQRQGEEDESGGYLHGRRKERKQTEAMWRKMGVQRLGLTQQAG